MRERLIVLCVRLFVLTHCRLFWRLALRLHWGRPARDVARLEKDKGLR